MKGSRKAPTRREPEIVGWRELVALPDLGITEVRAKIDTGARTSALHAKHIETFERDGMNHVRFHVPASRRHKAFKIETPVHDERAIKNTSGIPETRIVVKTLLVLGRHRWIVDVSLANREQMEFDLILGRTALRGRRLLVNPGKSFVAGSPHTE